MPLQILKLKIEREKESVGIITKMESYVNQLLFNYNCAGYYRYGELSKILISLHYKSSKS